MNQTMVTTPIRHVSKYSTGQINKQSFASSAVKSPASVGTGCEEQPILTVKPENAIKKFRIATLNTS